MDELGAATAQALIDRWYREHYRCVYQSLRRRLGCSHEDAEDLTEEVYERAYSSLKGQPEPITHPRAWLLKFGAYLCCEVYAASSPSALPLAWSSEEGASLDAQVADPDDQPENAVERQEFLQLVYGLLETLPREQHEAILLHCRDGYTYQQIAARYSGRAARTIRQDVQKGMRSLQEHWRQLDY